MEITYDYYRIFYYVAKYRNFTKAARVLGNSQPNITRAMNCLEQQVHATLFIRTNRGVQLTSEGERLYVRVSAAMTQLFAAEEELGERNFIIMYLLRWLRFLQRKRLFRKMMACCTVIL